MLPKHGQVADVAADEIVLPMLERAMLSITISALVTREHMLVAMVVHWLTEGKEIVAEETKAGKPRSWSGIILVEAVGNIFGLVVSVLMDLLWSMQNIIVIILNSRWT